MVTYVEAAKSAAGVVKPSYKRAFFRARVRVRVEGVWYPLISSLCERAIVRTPDGVFWVSWSRVDALRFGIRSHLRTRSVDLIRALCTYYKPCQLARTHMFPHMVLSNPATTATHPTRGKAPVYRKRKRMPERYGSVGCPTPSKGEAKPIKVERSVVQLAGTRTMRLATASVIAQGNVVEVCPRCKSQPGNKNVCAGVQQAHPAQSVQTPDSLLSSRTVPSSAEQIRRGVLLSTLSTSPDYLSLLLPAALRECAGMNLTALQIGQMASFGVLPGHCVAALSALSASLLLTPSHLSELIRDSSLVRGQVFLTLDYVPTPPQVPKLESLRVTLMEDTPLDLVPSLSLFPRPDQVKVGLSQHLFSSCILERTSSWPCGCQEAQSCVREVSRLPYPLSLIHI